MVSGEKGVEQAGSTWLLVERSRAGEEGEGRRRRGEREMQN